jgi:hypothetical protein
MYVTYIKSCDLEADSNRFIAQLIMSVNIFLKAGESGVGDG